MTLWPFNRRRTPANRWDLSVPLLNWSKQDPWTIRDAVAGTLCLGATGSGKSSGSGRTIARAFLDAGFGGLVLTAKPGEAAEWRQYCAAAGREEDLVIFTATGELVFNFLDHELQCGGGASLTENLLRLFSTVLEIAERSPGAAGREDQGYWRLACRQLIRNFIDLLVIARGRVSVPDLYRAVVSAPTSSEQLASEKWQAESFCFSLLREADSKAKSAQQSADFLMVADYLCLEFPNLSEKTRSVIVSTFTSMVDVLARGVLKRLFCTGTTVQPEATQEGKVLVIDLSVKAFADVGQFAQVLWKHAWQRAIERRPVDDATRPVFLWADEAQYFVTSYDTQFATTCRAARVATVFLTQNISNFEAALGGGEKAKAETASLFANLNTKLFHANGDPVTNQWASNLIGRSLQHFANSNASNNGQDWAAASLGLCLPGQASAGFSEAYEFEVQPGDFSRLRTGGPEHSWEVDAVLFQNGAKFRRTLRPWMPVTFNQRSK